MLAGNLLVSFQQNIHGAAQRLPPILESHPLFTAVSFQQDEFYAALVNRHRSNRDQSAAWKSAGRKLIYIYTLIHTHTNFPMCFALFVVTLTARDSREIAFSYQGAVPTLHLTPCEAAKDQLLLVGNDIIERQQQIWSLFRFKHPK